MQSALESDSLLLLHDRGIGRTYQYLVIFRQGMKEVKRIALPNSLGMPRSAAARCEEYSLLLSLDCILSGLRAI
jgi:hypothetical protein